jgi:hypothetical protein
VAARLTGEEELARRLRALAKARGRLVPVDTGNLRATGHVQPPVIAGRGVSVELGYGGTAGPNMRLPAPERLETGQVGYAVHVHENLTAHHTVGQAKYLETPLKAAKALLAKNLGLPIKAAMRTKRGGRRWLR